MLISVRVASIIAIKNTPHHRFLPLLANGARSWNNNGISRYYIPNWDAGRVVMGAGIESDGVWGSSKTKRCVGGTTSTQKMRDIHVHRTVKRSGMRGVIFHHLAMSLMVADGLFRDNGASGQEMGCEGILAAENTTIGCTEKRELGMGVTGDRKRDVRAKKGSVKPFQSILCWEKGGGDRSWISLDRVHRTLAYGDRA